MITLQLSREEAHKLEIYLLMSTKFRTGEAEALDRRYHWMKEEGDVDDSVLKKLKSNAAFWKEQCDVMNTIQERLQHSLCSPQQSERGENHES